MLIKADRDFNFGLPEKSTLQGIPLGTSPESVKKTDNTAQPKGEGASTEEATKTGYQRSEDLAFCPQKELNLPANYEEVVERFNRLQAGRAMEALN